MARFVPPKVNRVQRNDEKSENMLTAAPGDYAMEVWCSVTKRPIDSLTEESCDAIGNAVDHWMEHQEENGKPRSNSFLSSVVRAAAHLPSLDAHDDQDTLRLTQCLRVPSVYQAALHMVSHPHCGIITFTMSQHTAHTMEKIISLGGNTDYENIVDEERGYAIKMYIHTLEDIEHLYSLRPGIPYSEAYQRLEKDKKKTSLYPSVSKNNVLTKEKWRARNLPHKSVAKPKKVDFYEEGRQQEEAATGHHLDLDEYANDILIQGATMDAVLEYHTSVPLGYWDTVNAKMMDTDMDIYDIYDSLESAYNFHPSQRIQPLI